PRHVHTCLGFRHGTAENHVVDFGFRHLGMPFQKLIEHSRRHVIRTSVLERTAPGFTNRGPQTIDHHCFIHRFLLTSSRHQFIMVFPVLTIFFIRSCFYGLPHRLKNASRSRSRRYCSVTVCSPVNRPPLKTCASFSPITAS